MIHEVDNKGYISMFRIHEVDDEILPLLMVDRYGFMVVVVVASSRYLFDGFLWVVQ